MINIVHKEDCCGCNACGDVCPKGAITFVKDEEGFLYPIIDKALCVNCGQCEKVCPQLHAETLKRNEYAEPKCYAAVHKNFYIRFDSTSGGAFSACADVIYRQGGYVGGAVWTDDFYITQYISDQKSDLPRLRSSKYAQSDARGFYKAVKAAVLTGKPVLVCGTPCQMSALRLFMVKNYDNLYIMDFICRGNNSPLVFRKYLDWQEERVGSKVVYVKPKNKEMGWRQLTTKIVFKNGTVIYDTRETSNFTKGYLETNAYCRPSCYACKCKGVPRIADISVADFWGVKGQLPQKLDFDLGTSLVMISNSRGEYLWNQARSSMLTMDFPWGQALKGNPMLVESLPSPMCNRKEFFEVLNNGGFANVVERYIDKKTHITLWGHIKSRIKDYLRFIWRYYNSPLLLLRLIKDNGIVRVLKLQANLVTRPGVLLEIEGSLDLKGRLHLGFGYFHKALKKTGLAIRKGGVLRTSGPWAEFLYGADIEIFSGGTLELGAEVGFNQDATIICADHIKIGNGVKGGRHITIRDNNGGHAMNFPGYKNTKPVEIGDHVWLCEGCTIMPGVKIGAGAVVGAKAVVFNNVPANTMVMGNPAQVVCEQVEWKY